MTAPGDSLLPVASLVSDPSHVVACGALGLTMYLANGLGWVHEGAALAFDRWLDRVPRERLRFYWSSSDRRFVPLQGDSIDRLRRALALPWHASRPRHLLEVRVTDATCAPGVSFAYRELDEERGPCAGYLQALLPEEGPADGLLALAHEWLGLGLVWSAVGGRVASVSDAQFGSAYKTLRAYCRRYVAVDAQRPEDFVWHARRGITAVNWLTYLGAPLLARFAAARVAPPADGARRFGVSVARLAGGVLVRAGEAPTLGDLNRLEYPHAFAEAAHLLREYSLEAPPEFPHWAGGTLAWARRFVEPEGWK